MPRPFPVEFRRRAVALVRAGKPITTAAVELGVSAAAIHNWVRQDQIDRGERPGITTPESIELAKAKKRIFATRGRSRDLEESIAAVRGGSAWPKRVYPMIDALVETGHRVTLCCRLLGVSSRRILQIQEPTSLCDPDAPAVAHRSDSRGPYGVSADLRFQARARRTHPRDGCQSQRAARRRPDEQRQDRWTTGTCESETPPRCRHRRRSCSSQVPSPLPERTLGHRYHRTSHERRKGFCCAVMDTFSRKIVGWSIDNAQDSTLVVNALDMAIKNREPGPGGIVHADHGVQFTSWAFTNKIRASGLMPSFGTIGDCYDNSIDKNPSGRACRSSC